MPSGGRTGVVLVVEDDWLIRAEIVDELKRCGWKVLEASTGEGAIGLLHTLEPIDVVMTDIQLGGFLNGWDVAEAGRAARPKIAVIYVSGNAFNPNRAVHDSLFLGKPYRASHVAEACRSLLRA
jgi:CheY-like chemotaxis protein